MHDDQPTVPILGRYRPSASAESANPGEMPTWPASGDPTQHALGPNRPPRGYVSATALGVSLGANVVLLVGLLGLLLLSRAGFFSPGTSTGHSSPGVSTPGSALSSPTATSSAIPLSGWLQVAPSTIHLGCDDGQKNQFVILQNSGPTKVRWQADLSVPGDQAGVSVAPDHGELDAGASMPLQIQNMTHSADAQGVSSQQGVMRFDPDNPDAGPPASLSYTTAGCQ